MMNYFGFREASLPFVDFAGAECGSRKCPPWVWRPAAPWAY